jgi:hypothetical protein
MRNFLYPDLLLFVEIKSQNIPFIQMVMLEVFKHLLLTLLMPCKPTPNLRLYNELLSAIIYNQISSSFGWISTM